MKHRDGICVDRTRATRNDRYELYCHHRDAIQTHNRTGSPSARSRLYARNRPRVCEAIRLIRTVTGRIRFGIQRSDTLAPLARMYH